MEGLKKIRPRLNDDHVRMAQRKLGPDSIMKILRAQQKSGPDSIMTIYGGLKENQDLLTMMSDDHT
jgi:hypothetical protein